MHCGKDLILVYESSFRTTKGGGVARMTLFVYGSFVEGHVHYRKISNFVVEKRPATARGSVYRLEVGYPVFVSNDKCDIKGHLVSLAESRFTYNILDEFHGCNLKMPDKSLFWRVPLLVACEGRNVESFVYSINPNKLPKTARLIGDGDWERELVDSPPATIDLTAGQRHYLKKLGASSGRDIVPIDLQLYRELMGRGLIVDKGRRLALTGLGKEVYRYLDA